MQKVIIICYYWPPAGGPGVQRWLKFVTYLPEFDIAPVVYVPENASYAISDTALVNEIPKDLKIIKHPIFEPYHLASLISKKNTERISSGIIQKQQKQSLMEKLLLWVRGNLFIPDARKYWVNPSTRYLSKIIKEEQIQTVITTGPPHSIHLIGQKLRQKQKIRWIADFRDPWTSIGYHTKLKLSKSSQQKHQQLEKMVLNEADHIITTSQTTKDEFSKLTNKPIEVITNGFDGERLRPPLDIKFTISHIGSLLTDRNPECFWQAINELCEEDERFKTRLNIQLIGVVGEGVKESVAHYGLTDLVSFVGYLPHEEVLFRQAKSQILLLLEINAEETAGIIPGKLFEYLNAARPILAIGPKNWEVAHIIKETNSGQCLVSGDKSTVKDVILSYYRAYDKNELNSTATGIEKYHRRELTRALAKTITWES